MDNFDFENLIKNHIRTILKLIFNIEVMKLSTHKS